MSRRNPAVTRRWDALRGRGFTVADTIRVLNTERWNREDIGAEIEARTTGANMSAVNRRHANRQAAERALRADMIG